MDVPGGTVVLVTCTIVVATGGAGVTSAGAVVATDESEPATVVGTTTTTALVGGELGAGTVVPSGQGVPTGTGHGGAPPSEQIDVGGDGFTVVAGAGAVVNGGNCGRVVVVGAFVVAVVATTELDDELGPDVGGLYVGPGCVVVVGQSASVGGVVQCVHASAEGAWTAMNRPTAAVTPLTAMPIRR